MNPYENHIDSLRIIAGAHDAKTLLVKATERALIKDAEWQAGYSGWCPWCQCDNGQSHHEKSATCAGDCPAFTPSGDVK